MQLTKLGARCAAGASLVLATQPVAANETIAYSYDALGRLVAVARSGDVNGGISSDLDYDPAGNRTKYRITGATIGGGDPSEPSPSVSVSDAAVAEGGSLEFVISKDAVTAGVYSVSYRTSDGSAVVGDDYQAVSGTVTFQPAELSKSILVPTVNDNFYELGETMFLDIIGASGGATIADGRGEGAIADDEVPNAPPVANSESYAFSCAGGSYPVTTNDSDPDGDAIHIESVSGPLVSSFDASTIYVSGTTQSGTYVIHYIIADTHGATDNADLTLTWVDNSSQCGGGEQQ